MSFDPKTRDAILHLVALGFTLSAPASSTTTASAVAGTTTVPRPEHYKCGVCGETGHNSRGCPRKAAPATTPATPSGVGLAPSQARKSATPAAPTGGLDDLDFGDMLTSPAPAPKSSPPSKPAAVKASAKPAPVKAAPAPVAGPALDSLDSLDFGDVGTTTALASDLPTLDDAPAEGEATDSEVESELLDLGDLDEADLASVLG